MPAKKQKHQKQQKKQIQDQATELELEQENPEQIVSNKEGNSLQISSAEAQIYFQYLRKKISHQNNDPFSLPFLNLKFEQLQSWKGATQQLNLQSQIYGMRVDNCHDSTIKMLNHVIRNQQQQIGKDIGYDLLGNKEEQKTIKNKNNSGYNLEKPQKLNGNIELDKNLHNRSLWKAIFKKSQTLSQIHLNTAQLSLNLELSIDQSKINLSKNNGNQQISENQITCHNQENIYSQLGIQHMLGISQSLLFLKQIHACRKQINQEVQQIIIRSHQKKKKARIQQLQQVRSNNNFFLQDFQFMDFYQEFDEFQKLNKNHSQSDQAQIQQPQNQLEFIPRQFALHSIPIQHTTQVHQFEEIYYEQQSQNDQNQVYQPQKDFLFNSTFRKKKNRNIQKNVRLQRRIRQNIKINFAIDNNIDRRRSVFFKQPSKKTNIRNDNLIPISYVLLYQAKNPFRKLKKNFRTLEKHNEANIYQNYDGNSFQPNINQFESFEANQHTNNQFNFNSQIVYPSQALANESAPTSMEKKYKYVPMKIVKTQIKNQINYQRSFINSKPLQKSQQLYNSQHISVGLSNSIGLKYLRQKMSSYDPLDILVSMLHIAYEEQVKLQPIYSLKTESIQTSDQGDIQDILIAISENIAQT